MENLRLIVGLGNPGRRYAGTRHNAGYMLVERLSARWQTAWTVEQKFMARLAWAQREPHRLLLCQPETYMNVSGQAVGALAAYYQVPTERLLVAVDDADLPLGEIRLRARGSSGGHHGLESIEQHLGTREFARLRLGIGREAAAGREITDYVLSALRPEESAVMEKVLTRACEQVECWVDEGLVQAMNRFNGPVTD